MAKEWSSAQVVKGLLDALVLRVLQGGDNYGFGIIQQVASQLGDDGVVMREATLYPLLHRLEQKALVESYWQPGKRGTDRKYYRITREGRRHLDRLIDDWRTVARILEKIVFEDRGKRGHEDK